jgi:DNA-binding response OmpR family regulator
MRILLIEDDEVIAERIRFGLEKAHFSVDIALDGETGLQMARDGPYSLLILDLMLPGRDGWSVCEALRLRRSPLPILMLTARGGVQDRVRGLNQGADDYLPKPFDFGELLARIRALLRRSRSPGQRPGSPGSG